jgi:hypothetical protein
MCLLSIPGGNHGTGHFYIAKNRTFLLCVDTVGFLRSGRPAFLYASSFFNLWKDADPDIPILKEAKTEYAKLQ